ncbi:hypothetical protein GF339_22650, partial [candidate division KSB3 bacterium]|nr:hypothetical protein [candidate division KSB3 bacterium]MBD3327403.1 hypothetical protein [candidate division KSB3 bacterium]
FQTYQRLEQEEIAEFRYFATTLFDEMEAELRTLILREEKRAVDEYNYYLALSALDPEPSPARSPLSYLPKEQYILGYFQNNPDGSFQTPLVETGAAIPNDRQERIDRLVQANTRFNLKRVAISEELEVSPIGTTTQMQTQDQWNFAEKYLDLSRLREQKTQEVPEQRRSQSVTMDQVLNIAQVEQKQELMETFEDLRSAEPLGNAADREGHLAAKTEAEAPREEAKESPQPEISPAPRNLHVEVGPLQAVFISDQEIVLFRRIAIDNQMYRQGFVLLVNEFLTHLQETYFTGQPLEDFTRLRLEMMNQGQTVHQVQSGESTEKPVVSLTRVFPRPLSFLQATLTCATLPRSTGRSTVNIMMLLIGTVILVGLLTIYQSARSVVDLSERRSLFVSSVTHELKTPLTNIRMYVEMLEQGIASSREREEEYLRILGSESSRLSRLIDNVLEFSKLEKKQRRFKWQKGTFEEVLQEVQDIMQAKLQQEGFVLHVERDAIAPFWYDREVMVQILINLLDNSIKFGKTALGGRDLTLHIRSDGKQVTISVSDTGPGIPRHALHKIFDDFYRVDNKATQATRGTGIGLALVKKFVAALGGTVTAANNAGPGCTITLSLPARPTSVPGDRP